MRTQWLALPYQRVLGLSDEVLSQLEWIAADAAHAARSFTGSELGLMVLVCMLQSGFCTIRTQARAVGSAMRLASKLRKVDWRHAHLDLWRKCREAYHHLPVWAKQRWEEFKALSRRDREDEVVSLFLAGMILIFVSGGRDLEGGLPDRDMALFGMGAHRHVLSHTILLGLGLEFTIRLWLAFASRAYGRLPRDHHPIWDRIQGILKKNQDRLVAAGWVGIGAHLLKDGAFFSEATKPLVGLPVKASMDVHQLILRSNALAGSLIGMSIIGSPKTRVKKVVAQGAKNLFNLGRMRRFIKH